MKSSLYVVVKEMNGLSKGAMLPLRKSALNPSTLFMLGGLIPVDVTTVRPAKFYDRIRYCISMKLKQWKNRLHIRILKFLL